MTTFNAATQAPQSSVIAEYEPADVKAMLRDGKARLIDVREPDEHRRERIDGATLIPGGSITVDQISAGGSGGAGGGSDGVVSILHCRSGRRSLEAAQKLARAGHAGAASMKGGIEAWKAAGLPTTVDAKAPMPIMQQTQVVIGACVLASVLAGVFWNPWALIVAGFMACGLLFAGLSGTCGLAVVLAKMPWNKAPATSIGAQPTANRGKPGSCCGVGGCAS
jgi:rhodanese-related sulfurtransferase